MVRAAPDLPPPAEPATWTRRVETHDLDDHARAMSGWAQTPWSFDYAQMSPGSFNGQLHQVQLPGLRLLHETTSVALHQQGQLASGSFDFALPASPVPGSAVGSAAGLAAGLNNRAEAIFAGQRVGPNSMMTGRGTDIDLRTAPGFGLIAIVAEEWLLSPLWQRMYQKPLPAWLEAPLVHDVQAGHGQRLRRLHGQALSEAPVLMQAAGDPTAHTSADTSADARTLALRQLRDDLLIEWIEALPPSVDTRALPPLAQRRRLVDKARELTLSRPDSPLSVLALCCEVGASRRKLNYCFQDVLGMSPVQYLRALRLNTVRRELLTHSPGLAVQDVAARWGFWHLSQFSRDYRRLFAELPSATLRRQGHPHEKQTPGHPKCSPLGGVETARRRPWGAHEH